ncbi:PQQ-binding-like beta-propeller repeat protein [Amycolatopsis jejuensis]|uniref:outer membrane protein assembly factor BamB family protein n=1 Tax=Amycolatopsis jejuensis TaxID=330084 RepID=UPI0009FDA567|nr:PQQ-binding-like beta-propeller repeat protein [Amycolatopsis jejuensis]
MRRMMVTAACLGVMGTAVACGGSGLPGKGFPAGEAGAQPSASSEPAAKTADPPTAFDASAPVPLPTKAARANLGGGVVSNFLTLRDRTGYIVSPDSLSAVDVLTGKQKWSTPIEGAAADPNAQKGPFVNPTGPRPPVVTDKLAVAVVPVRVPEQGTTPGYLALAVLAVDPGTGAKVWQATVKVIDDQYGLAGSNSTVHVAAVTDQAVVASYSQASNDRAYTVALDPASGKQLWERKDLDAGSVNGDVVVGTDYDVAENSSMLQATALDLATGKQRWVGAAQSSSLSFFPADPALLVVTRKDYSGGHPSLLFLDPATGAEKAKFDGERSLTHLPYGDCLYDQQSVLACTSSGVLTGYDAKTAAKLWSLPDEAANRVAPEVTAAWHGALYGYTSSKNPIALDARTGKDLSTEVGITPVWVSKYAGVAVDDKGTPTAYPVKK